MSEPTSGLIAQHVSVAKVENGFVVTIYAWGQQVVMVAKVPEEVTGIIRGLKWESDRPLLEGGKEDLAAAIRRAQRDPVNPAPTPTRDAGYAEGGPVQTERPR